MGALLLVVLTAGVGVSLFPDDVRAPENLMILADAAVYHAERAGKNQVAFHAETGSPKPTGLGELVETPPRRVEV